MTRLRDDRDSDSYEPNDITSSDWASVRDDDYKVYPSVPTLEQLLRAARRGEGFNAAFAELILTDLISARNVLKLIASNKSNVASEDARGALDIMTMLQDGDL